MDEDVRVFDTEEVLKQLQALEASVLPPDAALVAKNRYTPITSSHRLLRH